ncbi:MAG: hypothetical protein ACK46R_01370 [Bacteroidota bacterium]|jgi:hypothetical protein
MFEKKPKLSYFVLGMFFGALCGGILVYYNSVITNENKISVNLIPEIVKQVIGVINTKSEQKKDTTDIAKETINIGNSDEVYDESLDESYNADGEQMELNADSSLADSNALSESEELITVRKEELLTAKEILIQTLDNSSSNKSNKNDSLLAVVSGTKDESKKNSQQKILVELWTSPINYKGYQASKNKIIFYGFNDIDELKLYSYKSNMYLKYNEIVYNIELSSDFSNYEKVSDSNILTLINKLNP